jgi:hypothetical protein
MLSRTTLLARKQCGDHVGKPQIFFAPLKGIKKWLKNKLYVSMSIAAKMEATGKNLTKNCMQLVQY